MAMLPPNVTPPMAPMGASPMTPLAGPSPAGGANPLAALAQRGASGGLPQPAHDLILFMAGMGASDFAKFIQTIRNPTGAGKGGGAKTALSKEAANNPAMTNPALMAMMQRLQPQAGATFGATPPNPLAMLAAR